MKNLSELKHKHRRVVHPILKERGDNGNGCFFLESPTQSNYLIFVLISSGEGWDHASVSLLNRKRKPVGRTPNWDEMNYVKEVFFNLEETVVQFHPKKSEYVNIHPYTLHLWRDQSAEYKLPPQLFV